MIDIFQRVIFYAPLSPGEQYPALNGRGLRSLRLSPLGV